jgi:transposase
MDANPPRKAYPSDLTQAQWLVVQPLLPPPLPGGRHRRKLGGEERARFPCHFFRPRSGCG